MHKVLEGLNIDARTAAGHPDHFHITLQTPDRVAIPPNLLADNTTSDHTRPITSNALSMVAQELLNQVKPALSFDQGDVTMFVMDMPDVPPQYAPVVIAQASSTQKGDAKTDRTIGVCQLIENQPESRISAINTLSVLGSVHDYFSKVEHREVGLDGKVSVLQGPEHGRLEGDDRGNYLYLGTPGYLGPDRATFLVEIGGYKVRAIYFFNVLKFVPGGRWIPSLRGQEVLPEGRDVENLP